MSRAATIAALLAVASPAVADDVFGAKRITRLDDVAWALAATCADHGDDTQQRQCRALRDARAKEVASAPMLVEGDATAFVVGAFDPAKKSAPVSLAGCVHCGGVTVEGKSYLVFGGAPRLVDGKVKPPLLHDATQTFADAKAYEAWKAKAVTARVDLAIKVAGKAAWSVGGKTGLAVDVVGYRVVVPCTGEVLLAKPASGPVEPDKKACTVATPAP